MALKLRAPVDHLLDGGFQELKPLDRVADMLQGLVRRVIPTGTPVKDALSGSWLGHPLHPALTDVVVGSWSSAWLLDLAGGKHSRRAADLLLGTGVIAALPTAAAGASDWAELRGGTRRTGLVHALGNSTALALQIASWRARRRGERGSGIALSTVAMGVASFSAYLGGTLSYRDGVGVDQTAFEDFPTAWTHVTDEVQLESGKPIRRSANGAGVMLVRHRDQIYALADRCSHRGCSLAEGQVRNGEITCSCHGSTYALANGSLVRGPATAPQPSLEVRVRDGKVEVRRPQAD